MKMLLMALLLLSSTAHGQDDMQQQLDQLKWEQRNLEREMQIQRYSDQVDRINARQQRRDIDIERTLKVEELLRQRERDAYKWDDADE